MGSLEASLTEQYAATKQLSNRKSQKQCFQCCNAFLKQLILGVIISYSIENSLFRTAPASLISILALLVNGGMAEEKVYCKVKSKHRCQFRPSIMIIESLLTFEAKQSEWILFKLLWISCSESIGSSHARDDSELMCVDESPCSCIRCTFLAVKQPHPRDDFDVAASEALSQQDRPASHRR